MKNPIPEKNMRIVGEPASYLTGSPTVKPGGGLMQPTPSLRDAPSTEGVGRLSPPRSLRSQPPSEES